MRDTLAGVFDVRVPATSANLGPGFDALGLAVDLHLRVRHRASERDRFSYRGDGTLADTPDNLIHHGFRRVFDAVGEKAPPAWFDVENPIPLSRGLGSSSAALVAGAALADAVLGNPLGRDGVFQLTAELEGHPDNVAPAVYGHFTVSARKTGGGFLSESLPIPEGWNLMFGVPDFELSTQKARSVLPERYTRADAIFTSSRTGLWALAVAKDMPELLSVACEDVLHEPYREPLIPRLLETRHLLGRAGAWAAYLSGAGPSIGVVCSAGCVTDCKKILARFAGASGAVLTLGPSAGYEVTEGDRGDAGPEPKNAGPTFAGSTNAEPG